MQKPSGIAWISADIFASIIAECNRALPNETGGVFLGYWARQREEAVITYATGPGPDAVHLPRSFLPDDKYQESEIARHYHASGRLHTYLGDWHTHPQQNAYLSRRDRLTLKKIAFHPEARISTPIMAIFGNGPDWKSKIWRYKRSTFGKLGLSGQTVPMELKIYS